MTTKFSQFADGGTLEEGDIVVGLSGGNNAKFTVPAFIAINYQLAPLDVTMDLNNGYITNQASPVTLTVPSGISVGDTFVIMAKSAGGFIVQTQGTQYIQVGNQQTSLGGSVSSTAIGDTMYLVATGTDSLQILSGVTEEYSYT